MSDLQLISELENQIFSHTYFSDYQATFLNHQSVLIALDDHKMVGIVGWFEQSDTAEIIMIGVDEEYRRMSIATMLLKACISMLISRRVECLFIEVRSSNHAAIGLYESLGFKFNRKRIDYYEDPKEDALEMRLEL